MDTADALLSRFLRLWAPREVLMVGSTPVALADYAPVSGGVERHELGVVTDAAALSGLGRFDLAVVADQLEHIPRRAGVELLGRLKNLHTSRICVLLRPAVGHGRDWHGNDFLSLGFHDPREQSRVAPRRLYYYDLRSYNPERGWNNAGGWANPENFRRYRW